MFDWENVSKTFQLPEQTIQLLNKIHSGLIITKPEPRITNTTTRYPHPSSSNNKSKPRPVTSSFNVSNSRGTRAESDVVRLKPVEQSLSVRLIPVKPPIPINHLATVQASLNKLTEKNYDSQLVIIIDAHSHLQSQPHETNPMISIIELIFRTTSSGIHARLIDDLAKIESQVGAYIIVVFEQFDADVSCMNTDPVDPVADYDEFCRVTKQNDRCRSTASFFVHLVDKQLISPIYIVVLLRKWLDRVTIIVDIPDKLTEVEMVSELVSRFAPVLSKTYKDKDKDKDKDKNTEVEAEHCRDHIRKIQQFKVSEKKSFSSRVLFKYRDMASLFENKKN